MHKTLKDLCHSSCPKGTNNEKTEIEAPKIAFLKTFYGFTFIVQYITKVIYYVTVTVPSIVTSEIQYVIIMDSEEKTTFKIKLSGQF